MERFCGINHFIASLLCDQNKYALEKYENINDEALILLYKKNNDKAIIGTLFKRYGHIVYGVCLKYLKNVSDSQDLTMQIFEKLMDKLLDKDVLNFRPWLHVVCRNECLMLLRKQGRVYEKSLEDSAELVQDETALQEKQIEEAQLQQLESALSELKPEQSTCIELFYIKEKCYQDISDQTGYSLKQVKSYIQNGKRNLKNILLQKNEFAVNKTTQS